jgi:hypothetical protein
MLVTGLMLSGDSESHSGTDSTKATRVFGDGGSDVIVESVGWVK